MKTTSEDKVEFSQLQRSGEERFALDEELSLLDLLVALAKRRWMILKFTAAIALLSLVLVFLLPVKYEATARLLPPMQNQGSATALLSQLSGLSGAASLMGGALNIKNPSDVYVAMLKSRTIKDRLIDKFDLRKLYGKRTVTDARKKLESNTEIGSGKEGVITVTVEDRDPNRAKLLTEAYISELLDLAEKLAVSEASQRRLYFERQLEQEKTRLADAEVELKKTQQSTGMIMPGEQAKAVVGGLAQIRAMMAAKEVQIGAMRTYATEQNPQLIQAQRELEGLRGQLRQMEREQPGDSGNALMAVGKLPQASLEFVRKFRDFKYHETLFEMIAKQYEIARLDEAKDVAMIQVLDPPVVPDKRSKPMRILIISLSTLAGLFLACVAAFVLESRLARGYSTVEAEKMEFLRRIWPKHT